MINKVIELLKKSSVSGYRVNETKTESFELFFVHDKLETIRSTDTNNINAVVYMEHDGKIGSADFKVYQSSTEQDIKNLIESSKEKALKIDNEFFTLPAKEEGFFDSKSNFKNYSFEELAEKISDAVFAAKTDKNSSSNATEIFVYKYTVRVVNSNGLDKKEVRYEAMVEAIPTYNGSEQSVELYEQYRFNEFDEETLVNEIKEKLEEVKYRYEAKKPDFEINTNILLRASDLFSVYGNISRQLNYNSVYSHSNLFKIGDDIQKDSKGDKLTITGKGSIKGSVNSSNFDRDGVTLIDTKLIEDGKVINYYGPNDKAQYVKMPVTGDLRCIEVKPGSKSKEEFLKEPHLECVSLSGIQVNPIQDYIGGEIRLAYYFDGKKTIPVTGISFAGKLSEFLNNSELSKEEAVFLGYHGPALVRSNVFKVL